MVTFSGMQKIIGNYLWFFFLWKIPNRIITDMLRAFLMKEVALLQLTVVFSFIGFKKWMLVGL